MDLYSRLIVGWALGDTIDRRSPPEGLAHHTDRGSPYTSIECFYNSHRRHSTLGFQSPRDLERLASTKGSQAARSRRANQAEKNNHRVSEWFPQVTSLPPAPPRLLVRA